MTVHAVVDFSEDWEFHHATGMVAAQTVDTAWR
jgi:hypothetical protein